MTRAREAEALDAYSSLVHHAAETVGPAVVRIETQSTRGRRGEGHGQGSGVIFRRGGQILTNAHVVDGAHTIRVVLADGRQFEAGLIGADPSHDIAELRIGARDLPVAALTERPLTVGQLVVAVGNPMGLGWTVTSGVVSALGRELPNPRGGKLKDLIQTDAPINPGSSGGPLVDTRGRVVGITTAVVPFAQGLGFAVPTPSALSILAGFSRPVQPSLPLSLGVGGTSTRIPDWIVSRNRMSQKRGILVLEIKPDSPAETASLKLNDIILELNGRPVHSAADLSRALKDCRAGDAVTVAFMREGTRRQVTVNLVERINHHAKT
jgi:S1-C subfamily serine protease